MIKIIAQLSFKKETVAKAIDLAAELVVATRKEKGCIQYDLLRANDEPEKLVILETWESQEVLDVHTASEHFTRIIPQLDALCVTPTIVTSYTQWI